MTAHQRRAMIAARNDRLRCSFGLAVDVQGCLVLTRGVALLDVEARARVLAALAAFADFTPDNDPYGEHDFAAFTVDGRRFNFKIDYFENSDMEFGADDPLEAYRVCTLLLAEEY